MTYEVVIGLEVHVQVKTRSKMFTRVAQGYGQPENTLTDPVVLDRIRALVIPPAWNDVWICSVASGHIQATGVDARGRRQYRYHDQWRVQRDLAKHDRILDFGSRLPAARQRIRTDLHGDRYQ